MIAHKKVELVEIDGKFDVYLSTVHPLPLFLLNGHGEIYLNDVSLSDILEVMGEDNLLKIKRLILGRKVGDMILEGVEIKWKNR